MLNLISRLRRRASDEGGFTLIELLVVILIIGILAAIAIPLFLNQTQKANDSSAESLVRNAATEASTYATDEQGSFKGLSVVEVHKLEPSIPVTETEGSACAETSKNACLVTAKEIAGSEGKGYVITAEAAQTKHQYTLENNNGVVSRTCTPANEGSCKNGSW